LSNMLEEPRKEPLEEEGDSTPEMLEIIERYNAGEKVKDLSKEFGIPKATIYDRFKKGGVTTGGAAAHRGKALSAVRKVEVENLAAEAEKIATIAVKLGGVIARRYMATLDYLMGENKSLELIAEEIMSWYEDKRGVMKRIESLEASQAHLYEQLELAYGQALPNFKYELRTRLLTKYATQVLKARMYGVRLPVKRLIKAYHNELVLLENDIENIKIIEEEMVQIG